MARSAKRTRASLGLFPVVFGRRLPHGVVVLDHLKVPEAQTRRVNAAAAKPVGDPPNGARLNHQGGHLRRNKAVGLPI